MNEELHYPSEEVFRVSEWIFRQRTQQITREEEAALNAWKSRSPANEQLFNRLAGNRLLQEEMRLLWEAAGETETARQRVLLQCAAGGEERSKSPKSRFTWWLWAAAAAVVLFAGMAGYELINRKTTNNQTVTKTNNGYPRDVPPGTYTARLTLADGSAIDLDSAAVGKLARQGNADIINQTGQLQYDARGAPATGNYFNTLSTGNGQTYALMLADKSRVWLNAGSSIRFPAAFTGPERSVTIQGEAYFEVAPDASRPFTVNVTDAGGNLSGKVQVTGTAFNIMAYGDEAVATLTLLSGNVNVVAGNQPAKPLLAGQQAQWGREQVKLINGANTEQAVGWKNGLFYLQGTTVDELMRQVARWYNVEVVYAAGVDHSQRITGKVPRSISLANLIKVLQLTDVDCHIDPGKAPPGKAGRLIVAPTE